MHGLYSTFEPYIPQSSEFLLEYTINNAEFHQAIFLCVHTCIFCILVIFTPFLLSLFHAPDSFFPSELLLISSVLFCHRVSFVVYFKFDLIILCPCLFYMYEYLPCMYVSTKWVSGTPRNQKRELEPLELELKILVRHRVGTANQTQVLWRAAISLVPDPVRLSMDAQRSVEPFPVATPLKRESLPPTVASNFMYHQE